ncbi:MAG: hypothetical protein HY700_14550 [Gemmatimonadetes bacterium]|nr:hypothetical protein [Gemmatimonadota bacterium]
MTIRWFAVALMLLASGCLGGTEYTILGEAAGSATVMTADAVDVKADGVSTATILVEVKDANRVTLTQGGDDVALSTTRGTLSPVVDLHTGFYSAKLTSTTAGKATVSGSVNGQLISTGNPEVTFVP